ncbi:hypothetical protein Pan14r_04790 [Crateriforma conspicua]|uniref:Uncharacterized protein n=1 Tax=Crateriforma conspicua TaxID=2527996 RepID=A0A5C5Y1Q3_9PLAN|nr:hypothetical protein Mal65_21280 [Crateriforma conspicua]TWT68235.1 hypothetical protein Pan14r_04790 [Crateriforma conspicua]
MKTRLRVDLGGSVVSDGRQRSHQTSIDEGFVLGWLAKAIGLRQPFKPLGSLFLQIPCRYARRPLV